MELTVSIALIMMIAVVSYPSLSLIIRSWNSVEFGTTPNDLFATERFVRQKIQQAALIYEKERSTRENLLVFTGHEYGFKFVSAMDDFLKRPGLYLTSFELEENNAKQSIIFAYQRYTDAGNGESTTVERAILLDDVSGANINYYSNNARKWVTDWADQKQLPALIRFRFLDASAKTKQWVVAPKMARNTHHMAEL